MNARDSLRSFRLKFVWSRAVPKPVQVYKHSLKFEVAPPSSKSPALIFRRELLVPANENSYQSYTIR